MRPVIAQLVRLYPAGWRARYGDELAALLEERPLGPFDVADVLLGALDAHLNLRGLGAASQHAKGFALSLRIGGYAAILSGLLWLVVLAGNAINNGAESGSTVLGISVVIATVMTLIALVGLSAFQARRHPLLIWAAFVIPAFGGVMGLLGFVAMIILGDSDAELAGGMSVWLLSTLGLLTMVLGSVLFAIATWLARSLSRGGAALLGIGALLVVPALAGATGAFGPPVIGFALLAIAVIGFPAGWMALGVSALRVGRGPVLSMGGASA